MLEFGCEKQFVDITRKCTFEWDIYVPDTITAGTFPDSIISRDLNDYLEFEKVMTGAGYLGRLAVTLPANTFFIPVLICGVGEKVDPDNDANKYIYGVIFEENSMWGLGGTKWQGEGPTYYDRIMDTLYSPGIAYGKYMLIYYYVNNLGTYRGRFHNFRILEVKV